MSLLTSFLDSLELIQSERINVHEERCVLARNRNAQCLKCANACTTGALSVVDGELAVRPERCIGCGTCATACPTCALEIKDPDDNELTRAVVRSMKSTGGHPVIACSNAYDIALARAEREATGLLRKKRVVPNPIQVVEVLCLGRVDESLLTGMKAYGARDVTLVCADCNACKHQPGGCMVRTVVESASNLIGAFGGSFPISIETEIPERVFADEKEIARENLELRNNSRREFLTTVKGSATKTVCKTAEKEAAQRLGKEEEKPTDPRYRKVGKDGTLSHFVPERRVRLYNYLNHIGKPEAETVESRLIGAISIDTEACSSCRMCAVFCPTAALKRVETDEVWGMLHRPSACVQCHTCESICPQGALTVGNEISIGQFLGKKALVYNMEKPMWQPNKPESLFNKIHHVLGDDLNAIAF